MNDVVIKAENLGKKYTIGHQAERERDTTFREVIVQNARNLWHKTRDLATGRPIIQGESLEEVWALKDVSFEIHRGEAVGIIGRNGAGKSTLLKILSRITEPSEGRVTIRGRVASLLEVGTGFHSELSGRENIYLNGAILGMTRAEIKRKFDEIVAFAEVEKYLDTPVKRYSSGMYVRLAFAVAAHLEPEILVVDEVLAVGDASFQKKCLGKMDEVAKQQGRTVLFVSHNMAAIQNLCERSVLLSQGKVILDASTNQTVQRYLDSMHDPEVHTLSERKDRKGKGDIRFTRVEFLDDNAKPIMETITGQKLVIRLHYQTSGDREFRNCRASVSFHGNGTIFFLASTELVHDQELIIKGNGHLDCIYDELPLSKGGYYLNLFIESNKVIQDWIEGAAELMVMDGDYYGTGRNYPPGWEGKTVLVRHHWEW